MTLLGRCAGFLACSIILTPPMPEQIKLQQALFGYRDGHNLLAASTALAPRVRQFLATEIKHTGLLSGGFTRLPHYFAPFQAFVIRQAEQEGQRFTMPMALLVLEREAAYRAERSTPAGLFVYQFEASCRTRRKRKRNCTI